MTSPGKSGARTLLVLPWTAAFWTDSSFPWPACKTESLSCAQYYLLSSNTDAILIVAQEFSNGNGQTNAWDICHKRILLGKTFQYHKCEKKDG